MAFEPAAVAGAAVGVTHEHDVTRLRVDDGIMITKRERYRKIVSVLTRHGIGVVKDQLIGHEAGHRARAAHLRQACEELGTMFIKLGQALSTRSDLLPQEYLTELVKLQDEVAPLPADVIADVIRTDLGAPPEHLFAFFDSKPLGSASIGQVHAARLRDGRDVVLKVRKPQVDEIVPIDLEILSELIDKWTPHVRVLEQVDARSLAQDFGDSLRAELDYGHEAENANFFRDVFAKERGFTVPHVIEDYSKKRVMTQELVEGRRASEVAGLSKRHRAVVARRIARFVLEPAFEHGVFYADPHPGNLLIQSDGSLTVIDFGKVGRIGPEVRRCLADMFLAIVASDAQRMTDRFVELTAPDHPVDRRAIRHEIQRMLTLYVDVSLENLRFGDAITVLLEDSRVLRSFTDWVLPNVEGIVRSAPSQALRHLSCRRGVRAMSPSFVRLSPSHPPRAPLRSKFPPAAVTSHPACHRTRRYSTCRRSSSRPPTTRCSGVNSAQTLHARVIGAGLLFRGAWSARARPGASNTGTSPGPSRRTGSRNRTNVLVQTYWAMIAQQGCNVACAGLRGQRERRPCDRRPRRRKRFRLTNRRR
jgi:predicted unusual protein kinase regulating ubiquinone biosynthesis (AarF/ABC1/UbiB family)